MTNSASAPPGNTRDAQGVRSAIRESILRLESRRRIAAAQVSALAAATRRTGPALGPGTAFPFEGRASLGLKPVGDVAGREPVYLLGDFLRHDGEEFIRNAFLGVLRREPDPGGRAHYEALLSGGGVTKREVLQRFLASEEGRRKGVRILGLEGWQSGPDPGAAGATTDPSPPPTITPAPVIGVHDLLRFQDEEFIVKAYESLLGRRPDRDGLLHHLEALRSGALGKIDLLWALHASEEGARAGVRVKGLRWRVRLRRLRALPLVGRAISIVQYAWRLPELVRNQEQLEAQVHMNRTMVERAGGDLRRLEDSLDRVREAVASARELAGEISAMAVSFPHIREFAGTLRSHQHALELLATRVSGCASRVQQQRFEGEVRAAFGKAVRGEDFSAFREIVGRGFETERRERTASLVSLKGDIVRSQGSIAAVEKRAGVLEQSAAALARDFEARSGGLSAEIIRVQEEARAAASAFSDQLAELKARLAGDSEEVERMFDSFYSQFEERFRGTPDEVTAKIERYVPLVRDAGAGTPDAPVLDIGCGRGEWLRLLKDRGLVAKGIDLNRITVERCASEGLDVSRHDAVSYLGDAAPGSLGAITGFHIIEHLSFRQLLELLDNALRALRPGGVAVFETPNPENLVVGACNFYFDPTHVKPLPPESTRYLLEARGFVGVDILRVNPMPEQAHLRTGDASLRSALNHILNSAQDYAVVGYRAKG